MSFYDNSDRYRVMVRGAILGAIAVVVGLGAAKIAPNWPTTSPPGPGGPGALAAAFMTTLVNWAMIAIPVTWLLTALAGRLLLLERPAAIASLGLVLSLVTALILVLTVALAPIPAGFLDILARVIVPSAGAITCYAQVAAYAVLGSHRPSYLDE